VGFGGLDFQLQTVAHNYKSFQEELHVGMAGGKDGDVICI